MKKILITLVCTFIGVTSFSQITVKNINTNFSGKLVCVYDSLNFEKSKILDSLNVLPDYINFINMCKGVYIYDTLSNIIIQNTSDQSGGEKRIILRKNAKTQMFIYYNSLSAINKTKYNNFILKVKENL